MAGTVRQDYLCLAPDTSITVFHFSASCESAGRVLRRTRAGDDTHGDQAFASGGHRQYRREVAIGRSTMGFGVPARTDT
jgi:hypothetical protein